MARRLCTVLVASLFLLTAACGTTDDDKADEKTETKDDAKTTTTAGGDEPDSTEDEGDGSTTTEGGGGGGDTEFCEAAADLNTMFDDLEEGDYQGMVDAIADAEGTFDAYLEALPDDLKDDGELLVESVKTLAEKVDDVKDDPDVEAKVEAAYNDLDTPELNAAGDAVDAYEDENCPDN
jgi:hypothetical protein